MEIFVQLKNEFQFVAVGHGDASLERVCGSRAKLSFAFELGSEVASGALAATRKCADSAVTKSGRAKTLRV